MDIPIIFRVGCVLLMLVIIRALVLRLIWPLGRFMEMAYPWIMGIAIAMMFAGILTER